MPFGMPGHSLSPASHRRTSEPPSRPPLSALTLSPSRCRTTALHLSHSRCRFDSIREMRKFLVPRASIENVNIVQSEAEVEEPPPNVANEFNSNEILPPSFM
ncbi:hypothetical protein QL285_029090 [Trifolium repens]|nr:hypothetical protein QL285_029090 [Trifolium repens]